MLFGGSFLLPICSYPNKMRRRHLESVSAALYGRCFCIVRIQPQLKR